MYEKSNENFDVEQGTSGTYKVEVTGWKAGPDMKDEMMCFTLPRLLVPVDPEKQVYLNYLFIA